MPTIMDEFDLMEISAVDRPAQAHAKAVIIKRAPKPGEPGYEAKGGGKGKKPRKGGGVSGGGKGPIDLGVDEEEDELDKTKGKKPAKKSSDMMDYAMILTSAEDGHAHLLEMSPRQQGGTLDYATGDASEGSHNHPWARNADGTIEVGLADGHGHTVDPEEVDRALLRMIKSHSEASKADDSDKTAAAAAKQEGTMPENQSDELSQLQAQNADLTKRAERAEQVALLKSDQREHFAGLDTEGQDTFLGKSEDERSDVIKALGDADPVVFKSADGTEFRKSDDPRMVKMAQERDEDRATIKAERDAREGLELAKRADAELSNLPGTAEVRGQLLKAVDGIEDEDTRKGVMEALTGANQGIFERASGSPEQNGLGKGEGFKPSAGGAEAQLETLVKAFAKDNNVTEPKAWSEVLKTEEGATLYNKSTTEQQLPN